MLTLLMSVSAFIQRHRTLDDGVAKGLSLPVHVPRADGQLSMQTCAWSIASSNNTPLSRAAHTSSQQPAQPEPDFLPRPSGEPDQHHLAAKVNFGFLSSATAPGVDGPAMFVSCSTTTHQGIQLYIYQLFLWLRPCCALAAVPEQQNIPPTSHFDATGLLQLRMSDSPIACDIHQQVQECKPHL